jgi:hypothetical protein
LDFCLVDTCLCKYHNLDVPVDKNHKREKASGTASGEKPREEKTDRDVGEGNYFLKASVK